MKLLNSVLYFLVVVSSCMAEGNLSRNGMEPKRDLQADIFFCQRNSSSPDPGLAVRSARLIGTHILELSDVKISCFSTGILSQSELDLTQVETLRFVNVTMTTINPNALTESIGSPLKEFEMINSTILYLNSQENYFDKVTIMNSEVGFFPPSLLVHDLYLQEMKNFSVNENTIQFLSSSTKRRLIMTGFFNDEMIYNLSSHLEDSELTIMLGNNRSNEAAILDISDGSLTNIPENLFSSDKIKFASKRVKLYLSNNVNLTHFGSNVFSGNERSRVSLKLSGCKSLEKLPMAVKELNLESFSIAETSIEDFEGFDFSKFDKLDIIVLEGAPVQPRCRKLRQFREKYGIRNKALL
eukprot:snap_masked-scaffold_20-processed-gene-1.8-mRNA-1 protein AED:1.00 eAED:1.00 QI:0/0/0/0/1/1/2/0/353